MWFHKYIAPLSVPCAQITREFPSLQVPPFHPLAKSKAAATGNIFSPGCFISWIYQDAFVIVD
jgi:hypothetical protein